MYLVALGTGAQETTGHPFDASRSTMIAGGATSNEEGEGACRWNDFPGEGTTSKHANMATKAMPKSERDTFNFPTCNEFDYIRFHACLNRWGG